MKAISLSSAIFLALGGALTIPAHATPLSTPTETLQAFLDTRDYQYLSREDKAVWSENDWQTLQMHSTQVDEPRLNDSHELYELEQFIREQVTIQAVSYEQAEDGAYRVTVESSYPVDLATLDDYAETANSQAYERLVMMKNALLSDALSADNLQQHASQMTWRVTDTGVFVNAAEMQRNLDALHAQDLDYSGSAVD